MFYDIEQAIDTCDEEPSLVFEAIKCNYREVYEYILDQGIDLNITDEQGDNILMKLLKNKDYDLVNKYILDSDIMINHQNNDGDTLAHLLVSMNYLDIKEIWNTSFGDGSKQKRINAPQSEWDIMQGLIMAYREGDIPVARAYLQKHAEGKEDKVTGVLRVCGGKHKGADPDDRALGSVVQSDEFHV